MDARGNAWPLAFVTSEGGTPAVVCRHLGPWIAAKDGPLLLATVGEFTSLVERSNHRPDSMFRDGTWDFVIEMDHDSSGVMDLFDIEACKRLQALGIGMQTYCQKDWAAGSAG